MSAKMMFLFLLMAVLFSTAASAQLGQGWVEYEPVKKIHLVDFNYKDNPKGIYSFEWKSKAEVGTPTPCSGYEYDPVTDTEIFRLYDSHANRAEIGIANFPIKGTPRVINNCYGKEVKVNVIHLQEDVGNKFFVYINDEKKLEFPDNEKVK